MITQGTKHTIIHTQKQYMPVCRPIFSKVAYPLISITDTCIFAATIGLQNNLLQKPCFNGRQADKFKRRTYPGDILFKRQLVMT